MSGCVTASVSVESAACVSCASVVWSRFEVAVSRLEDTEHVLIPVHLREKYKQSGFNHTSTPLFGQPFLLSVPRSVSEDKLYNLLLLRLWYLLTRLTAHTCPSAASYRS